MIKELRRKSSRHGILVIIGCSIVLAGVFAYIWKAGFKYIFEKPVYLNELKDDEIGIGRAQADIYFVYDYYATYGTDDGAVERKYYLIPVGEQSYMGLQASTKYMDELDQIMDVSYEYMMGTRKDIEGKYHVDGTIMEMTGDELRYYKEYYTGIDWADEEIFLPYTLKIDHYGNESPLTYILFGAIALGLLIAIIFTLVKMLRGNYQKMILDYCKNSSDYEQAMRRIEQFYYGTQPIHGFRISTEYLMALDGANVVFFEGKELLWAYMEINSGSGVNYQIYLYMKDLSCHIISVANEEIGQKVLSHIGKMYPHVFLGYSDELNEFYFGNHAEMIRVSEEVRKEVTLEMPEQNMEERFKEW